MVSEYVVTGIFNQSMLDHLWFSQGGRSEDDVFGSCLLLLISVLLVVHLQPSDPAISPISGLFLGVCGCGGGFLELQSLHPGDGAPEH